MPSEVTADAVQNTLAREIETIMALPPGDINTETYLPSLGMDSLRFVSLILAIEEKFGVNLMQGGITPEDTKTTIALANLILARRNS